MSHENKTLRKVIHGKHHPLYDVKVIINFVFYYLLFDTSIWTEVAEAAVHNDNVTHNRMKNLSVEKYATEIKHHAVEIILS